MPTVTLWDIEIMFVEMILVRNNGNRTHAARDLGVSVRTLRHWISETMDIKVPPGKNGRKKIP
jgi:DNA-binding protein Fis